MCMVRLTTVIRKISLMTCWSSCLTSLVLGCWLVTSTSFDRLTRKAMALSLQDLFLLSITASMLSAWMSFLSLAVASPGLMAKSVQYFPGLTELSLIMISHCYTYTAPSPHCLAQPLITSLFWPPPPPPSRNLPFFASKIIGCTTKTFSPLSSMPGGSDTTLKMLLVT